MVVVKWMCEVELAWFLRWPKLDCSDDCDESRGDDYDFHLDVFSFFGH